MLLLKVSQYHKLCNLRQVFGYNLEKCRSTNKFPRSIPIDASTWWNVSKLYHLFPAEILTLLTLSALQFNVYLPSSSFSSSVIQTYTAPLSCMSHTNNLDKDYQRRTTAWPLSVSCLLYCADDTMHHCEKVLLSTWRCSGAWYHPKQWALDNLYPCTHIYFSWTQLVHT